nr:immunoglobulin heavy chain junction region [Macaca mulatta]MOW75583.1 immunoglobulin heavy chain junction region [Macaca mulatta]MOW76092.1 immunoglobulin heavy chain junction region [Macaca mulatta]MOW76684.1 immunoglobulin heavy chain junction region [Macaca mulatta]MOW77320.1 immunoglobulin heavy chain junction region [Macaca mulatta]
CARNSRLKWLRTYNLLDVW